MDEDYMELGDSGLIPLGEGWMLDPRTGNKRSPDGKVFNNVGELIWDANITEDEEE